MAINQGLAGDCSTLSSGGITGLHLGNAADFTATVDGTSGIVTALTPTASQVMYAVALQGLKNATFTEESTNDPEVGGSESIPTLKFRVQYGSATDKFINQVIQAGQCGIVAIFKRGGAENNIVGYNPSYSLNTIKTTKNITGELKTGSYYDVELSGSTPVSSNSRFFTGTIPV
jgi:hypothetical protein